MTPEMQTLTTLVIGFTLCAIPMTVALISKSREIERLNDGYKKVADGWYAEVCDLKEQLWQERIK